MADSFGDMGMSNFEQIDRSLVAIFDIEAFSEQSPEKQAQMVQVFLTALSETVTQLGKLTPDTFSTGDGAILSIGRNCKVDQAATRHFLDCAIRLTASLCRQGVILRTALHYSEGDRLVFGTDAALRGQYIQVGDTINVAARVITFCEPREIMLTDAVQSLLRRHDLEYPLHRNEPLVTKHGVHLHTYTLVPMGDLAENLYSPSSPLQPYKRFIAFPPIKADTLRCFLSNGLDAELRKVVSSAYDAMNYINETKTFLSHSEVLQVLTRPNYDPTDEVYVVSRNDRPSGFWNQKRCNQYMSFLAGHAKRNGGVINQTRIWVYDPDAKDEQYLMNPVSIYEGVRKLHRPGTLYRFPSNLLHNYERIAELIFGFTLSKKHRYAIIPVPNADSLDVGRLRGERVGELLQMYKSYECGQRS
jgi:hypothetical protein